MLPPGATDLQHGPSRRTANVVYIEALGMRSHHWRLLHGVARVGIRHFFPTRRDLLLAGTEQKVVRRLDVPVTQGSVREHLPDEVDFWGAVLGPARSIGVHSPGEAAVGALVIRRRSVLHERHGTEPEEVVDGEASAEGIPLLVQERGHQLRRAPAQGVACKGQPARARLLDFGQPVVRLHLRQKGLELDFDPEVNLEAVELDSAVLNAVRRTRGPVVVLLVCWGKVRVREHPDVDLGVGTPESPYARAVLHPKPRVVGVVQHPKELGIRSKLCRGGLVDSQPGPF